MRIILEAAKEIATVLKRSFKNANDWEETNSHAIEAEKLFALPPVNLEGESV
jgi:hypothetical protein